MDNRELVNSELSKILDSGIVSIKNNKSSSINELPQGETPDQNISAGSLTNNYNVVVNVAGSAKVSQPISESKNIVNNILRNNNIESPQDIKKNYSESLKENLNLVPDNFSVNNTNLNVNSYPDTFNYNNLMLQDNDFLPSKTFESKLEVLNSISNSAKNVSNQNLGANTSSIQENSISNYSYSSADIKNKNNSLNIAFESLNNVMQHSLGVNGKIGGTVLNNEIYVDKKSDQLNVYKNTVEIKNQSTTTLEEMDDRIREMDRSEKIRSKMIERSTLQMEESNDRKESEEIDLSSQMEDTIPISKEDYSTTPTKQFNDRSISHINSTDFSINYNNFVNKMNSPPIWRTVLG